MSIDVDARLRLGLASDQSGVTDACGVLVLGFEGGGVSLCLPGHSLVVIP